MHSRQLLLYMEESNKVSTLRVNVISARYTYFITTWVKLILPLSYKDISHVFATTRSSGSQLHLHREYNGWRRR